ncbi:hypothetical protein GCK32_013744, partial [Trichostrongylus colubriformis]
MALYFHKSSLKRATSTLISQIDTFRVFANEPQYPLDYAERIDYCIKNASAIENAISIISTTRSDILQIIENVKKEYSETKKSDRKEFLDEFQIIETETSYNETAAAVHTLFSNKAKSSEPSDIRPSYMADDLDEEIRLMEYTQAATLDAIGNTLQALTNRLDSLYTLTAEMRADITVLLERTAPKSSCIFCTVTENVDGHYTGRCHRYSDPVSRAMRVAELRLCSRCLRPDHGAALCTVSCSICRG